MRCRLSLSWKTKGGMTDEQTSTNCGLLKSQSSCKVQDPFPKASQHLQGGNFVKTTLTYLPFMMATWFSSACGALILANTSSSVCATPCDHQKILVPIKRPGQSVYYQTTGADQTDISLTTCPYETHDSALTGWVHKKAVYPGHA